MTTRERTAGMGRSQALISDGNDVTTLLFANRSDNILKGELANVDGYEPCVKDLRPCGFRQV